MKNLETKIGYEFRDSSLLITALTHSSYANEHNCESYERLEFLGDSILGQITAEYLYRHEPKLPEGRMTRLRSELVCEDSLYEVALWLNLGSYMKLGKGAESSGGRSRKSVLADMVEAILAAMYLDGGMDHPRNFITDRILKSADLSAQHRAMDFKTELQELIQQENNHTISYEMIGESGPDHNKTFSFRVLLDGKETGEGSGKTKKEAEQNAAREALIRMKNKT